MQLLDELFQGRLQAFCINPEGQGRHEESLPQTILAGSFNPLHDAHLKLAEVAAGLLNTAPHFELCVCNVDKPPLSEYEVTRRVRQFANRYPVWITRTPTFVEKAALFPGTTFVVGADTAERILAPRYYHGETDGLHNALATMKHHDCRFLVAGRRHREQFVQLHHLPVPSRFTELFVEIPQSLFQFDLSSTELRRQDSTDE